MVFFNQSINSLKLKLIILVLIIECSYDPRFHGFQLWIYFIDKIIVFPTWRLTFISFSTSPSHWVKNLLIFLQRTISILPFIIKKSHFNILNLPFQISSIIFLRIGIRLQKLDQSWNIDNLFFLNTDFRTRGFYQFIVILLT